MKKAIIFIVILQLAVSGFAAAEDINYPQDSNAAAYDSWSKSQTDLYKFGKEPSVAGRLVVSLVLVAVLGAGAYFASKKLGPKISAASGKNIKIVEAASIGSQRQVVIIECGGKRFLIGATGQNISLIAELGKEQEQI